jgi:hypothetical protein
MGSGCCAECGFDFAGGVAAQIARSCRFPGVLEELLGSADPAALRRRRHPDVWSPLEYSAHVGEAVLWYVGRIRRVLGAERPRLEPFDWDAAALLGGYNRRSADRVCGDAAAACGELAALARSLRPEQLPRQGIGSDGSPRSTGLLLARAGHELAHHELDLRRGLGLAQMR